MGLSNKIVVVFFAFWFVFTSVKGQNDGDLDLSFGNQGKVAIDLGQNILGKINASYNTSEDNIIVVGNIRNVPVGDFDSLIAKFKSDGSLDTAFGVNGYIRIPVSTQDDLFNSIGILSNNDIIAGGWADFNDVRKPMLHKFKPDGSYDMSFGNNGILIIEIPNVQFGSYLKSLTIDQEDRIVVAGFSITTNNSGTHCAMRFTQDGQADITFGDNGFVHISVTGASDGSFTSIISGNKNSYLLTGYVYFSFEQIQKFILAKLNEDGTLNTDFGNSVDPGISIDGFDGSFGDQATTVKYSNTNDKIYIAGLTNINGGLDTSLALGRYSQDGTLDASFGDNGLVATNINSEWDIAQDLFVYPEGKILLTGNSGIGFEDDDFLLVRYYENGALDATFGNGGIVTTDFNNADDNSSSMIISSDGGVIISGSSNSGDLALAKYISNNLLGLEDKELIDKGFMVYPNPIHEFTEIHFVLESDDYLTINAIDIQGKVVRVFNDMTKFSAGQNKLKLDFSNIPSGTYLIQLKTSIATKTIQVIKD